MIFRQLTGSLKANCAFFLVLASHLALYGTTLGRSHLCFLKQSPFASLTFNLILLTSHIALNIW
jgi:hypothetical protein